MKYMNLKTGVKIDLGHLNETEKKFYRQALDKFQSNADWLAFDEFALGMNSPIYLNHTSRRDVAKNPLFLALRDMSLQLGIQQGKIAEPRGMRRPVVA